ncbi:glycosyltransferase [Actinomadura darangshiensis]|uniref:dolichyl-phosphate beta-glucosyltransferase n=1 Tax=Actinomadura darangshiensis TaxID=705336 RepID=A0A4R5BL98_9ACTN|nr:glycosyltransferase [Actinomadura darangshiensis]
MEEKSVPRPTGTETGTGKATLNIVIPVLNEERSLPGCVRTLHSFLDGSFPLSWRITILDNDSTDGTWRVAHDLAEQFPEVRPVRLPVRGKGAALKAAWCDSTAEIVAYMDADLSTGLDALLPLVAPLISGQSEIAIGSRLNPHSRIRRGLKRELVSRAYNGLLRYGFGVSFSDAQCGFKAARTEAVRPLLERVRSQGWFFDTEFLLLAEYNGLRVHEVPVDWVEDVDSRVRIARASWENLTGLARLAGTMATGRADLRLPRPRELRTAHPDAILARPRSARLPKVAAFGVIGAISTLLYVPLYVALRSVWPALAANFGALVLAGLFNTEANRRWTFNRAGGPLVVLHLKAATLFAASFAVTTAEVVVLHLTAPHAGKVVEVVLLGLGQLCITVLRYIGFDRWVFRRKD